MNKKIGLLLVSLVAAVPALSCVEPNVDVNAEIRRVQSVASRYDMNTVIADVRSIHELISSKLNIKDQPKLVDAFRKEIAKNTNVDLNNTFYNEVDGLVNGIYFEVKLRNGLEGVSCSAVEIVASYHVAIKTKMIGVAIKQLVLNSMHQLVADPNNKIAVVNNVEQSSMLPGFLLGGAFVTVAAGVLAFVGHKYWGWFKKGEETKPEPKK